MAPTGYTNLSATEAAAKAVRLLTVQVSAALGRRVTQSEAIRIAAKIVAQNQDRIVGAAEECGIDA